MPRKPVKSQAWGGEFSGNIQQNGTQPVPTWEDLKPSDQAGLIKRTGQDSNPSAPAHPMYFQGHAPNRRKPNVQGI